MKIIYIITELNIGGAEIMLYKLLSEMDQVRFSPIVISLMDRGTFGDQITALGIPVYTIGLKQGKPTPTKIWRLIHLIRQLKPDLIQGWMYHGNLAAWLARFSLFNKVPVLWSIHHSINSLASEKQMTSIIIRFSSNISKFVNEIVFVSKKSKIQHESLGYCSSKNSVIPNGFDLEAFKPSLEAKASVRAELHLPEETLLIGLICRFHPMKDHANFLKAAAILSENCSNCHFVLAGTDINMENSVLYNLVQDLGLCKKVHFLGERRDMPRITAALDIATSSSAYGEAFPLVLGEAMACGVPCVATDVGDSSWIIDCTGKIVPPRNPQALAEGWQELIELGAEGRKNLGQQARERIIANFSLKYVVNKFESLYEQVISVNSA